MLCVYLRIFSHVMSLHHACDVLPDENLIIRATTRLLVAIGVQESNIVQLHDGSEALQYIRTTVNPPSIMLMDINMPQITGDAVMLQV